MKNYKSPSIILFLILTLFSFKITVFSQFEPAGKCANLPMSEQEILKSKRIYEDIIKNSSNQKRNSSDKYIIPVVFHVMDLAGASRDDIRCRINDAVEMINADFQGLNGSTNIKKFEDTDMRFDDIKQTMNLEICLATKDPDGNILKDPGIDWQENQTDVTHGYDGDIFNYNWYGKNKRYYIDVFLVGCVKSDCKTNASGFAYLPAQNYMPMTVYNVRAVGRTCGSTAATYYNWANTLSHEFGHILGLPHTFWSNTGCHADGVNDTPATNGQDGCEADKKNSCGVYPNYENYMDYNIQCYRMWTTNQTQVMTYWLKDVSVASSPRGFLHTPQNLFNVGCSSVDDCPNDPNKTDPGICGCGIPEGSCDKDCSGTPAGLAYVDNCGNCVGGNTGKLPCPSICPNTPTVSDNFRCGEGEIGLSATASYGGTLSWYTSMSSETIVGTGVSFSTNVTNTSIYYVEETVDGIWNSGSVGPLDYNTIGNEKDYEVKDISRGLVFDALSSITIKTVDIFSVTKGEVVITLKNSSGTILASQIHQMNGNGKQIVKLNLSVPAGNDYELSMISNESTSVKVKRNYACDISYPFKLDDLVSIKRGTFSSTANGCNDYTDYYYYFYNWFVESSSNGCISNRVAVTATVDKTDLDQDGVLDCYVSIDELQDEQSVNIFPNPTSGLVNIHSPKTANYSYTVTDIVGKVVASGLVSGESFYTLNLNVVNNGVYLIKINSKGLSTVNSIVIEK